MKPLVCSPRICRRCGLCEAACPSGAVSLDLESGARVGETCTDCGLCGEICPALALDRNALLPEDLLPEAQDGPLGPVGQVWVGRCAGEDYSDRMASGGAVTALLRALLQTGRIDAAAGVAMDPSLPTRTRSLVVKKAADSGRLSGSCYQIAAHGRLIPELDRLGQKVAYVGLPCHIQALRKYQGLGKLQNVALAIGIFCGFNLLPEATDFLVRKLARRGEKPVEVEFRGGSWPGGFRVNWSSGRQSFVPKDDYSLCDLLYLPEFCGYCVDLGAELADLSFADAWYRPGGWSTVLCRTRTGRQFLETAAAGGGLELEPAELEDVEKTQAHTIAHKKRASLARLSGLPPDIRPVLSGYNLIAGRDPGWRGLKRRILGAARRAFEVLPLGAFLVTSKVCREVAVRLARRRTGSRADGLNPE